MLDPTPQLVGAQTSAEWPLVSVIIPTRGRPRALRAAVRGVLHQTYPGPVECLVVHDQEPPDPGLTDLTLPSRRVRVTANVRSPGLAGARNTGLERVAGPFVASCDDDDCWHPAKVETQMRWLAAHPEVGVVGCGIRLMLPDRVVDWPARSELVSHRQLLRGRVKELHSSALLVRRDVYEGIGGYDERLPFGYAEDYEWLLRAAAAIGPLGVVRAPLVDVNKDGDSWFVNRQQVVAEALQYLLECHPELRTSRRGEARVLGQIAFALTACGHRRAGMAFAGRALRRWPLTPHAALTVLHLATGWDAARWLRMARVLGRGIT